MIQSATNSTSQTSFGFENLARFGPQAQRQRGASRPEESGQEESTKTKIGAETLTPDQQAEIARLKATDRKVRAHEQAHLAVGADLVRGGPTYAYQTGPDNKRYAVSGEVSIDTSPASTPEKTIPKAQHIRATALAPAEPSAQDRSVAAKATSMESAARVEVAQQAQAEVREKLDARSAAQSEGAAFYLGVAQNDTDAVGSALSLFA